VPPDLEQANTPTITVGRPICIQGASIPETYCRYHSPLHRPYLLSLYDVTPTPRVLANLVRQGSRRYHAFSAKAYQPIGAVAGPFGRATKRFILNRTLPVRAQLFTGPPFFQGLGADVACNISPANLTAAMPACITWENLRL
jgi:hypothetical protein